MSDNLLKMRRLLFVILQVTMYTLAANGEDADNFQFWSGGELIPAGSNLLEAESASFEMMAPTPDPVVTTAIETGSTTDSSAVSSGDASAASDEEPDEEVVIVLDFYERNMIYESLYRVDNDSMTYLPGKGDDFGWISLDWRSGLEADKHFGLISRFGWHFLSGPDQTDIPHQVYDLVWGLQFRDEVGPLFAYDIAANFGIFADFKDSVREGIQYPGHAVGFLRSSPHFQFVFGVDYLGQDDIRILPVFGVHWKSVRPLIDAELVFPKPRISLLLDGHHRLYTAGSIGGGSWDIERPDETNDVFTYRDHRIAIGLETLEKKDGTRSFVEFGFSFNRQLSFRADPLDMELDQAFFIRLNSQN